MSLQRRKFISSLLVLGLYNLAWGQSKVLPIKSKIAVIYFSQSGNTRSVAEMIHQLTGADLFEIKPQVPYRSGYREIREDVSKERESEQFRPITPIDIDLSQYQFLIIGTPTWSSHIAHPIRVWLSSVNLSGKSLATFNTHAGGGEMLTFEEIKSLQPQAAFGEHLAFRGSAGFGSQRTLRQWLKNNAIPTLNR